MKKAGIITFHCADNFGAVLQVYALQQTLLNMNVDAEIIDYRPRAITASYNHDFNLALNIKRLGLARTIKIIMSKIYNYNQIKKRLESFNAFRRKYLRVSNRNYYTNEELLSDPPLYDFYITGSDQVWNPKFKESAGDSYFLDFVQGQGLKISYSVSISEKVDEQLINDYINLINSFDYISIREKSSLAFIKSLTTKDISVTLDPTLLLAQGQWDKISAEPSISKKYILVYDLQYNKELVDLANKLSELLNVGIFSFSTNRQYINRVDSFQRKSPAEFLGLFKNAELVLTNSFHGTVFSVIYRKLFFVILPKTRQSRIIDFLQDINLESRIVNKVEEINNLMEYIDYNEVDDILEKKKEQSLNFLKKSLGISDKNYQLK